MNTILVEMKNIQKSFDSKKALNNADMTLQRGEILGLVGDNGAGKSTLLKVLAGVLPMDQGTMIMDGKPVQIPSPRHARALGIEMVYQDLCLCGNMSIWENMFLGRYRTHALRKRLFPFLDKSCMKAQAGRTLRELGIDLSDMNQPIRTLSGGEQQAVAISRCLLFQPRIVLLDEPTASMAAWEQNRVLEMVRKLKAQGCSVIVVTHNLPEIFEVADRVLVLKKGESIWCGHTVDLTPKSLAQRMFVGKG